MNFEEFSKEILKYRLDLKNDEIKKLYNYMEILLCENEKYNLTSIKDPAVLSILSYILSAHS